MQCQDTNRFDAGAVHSGVRRLELNQSPTNRKPSNNPTMTCTAAKHKGIKQDGPRVITTARHLHRSATMTMELQRARQPSEHDT